MCARLDSGINFFDTANIYSNGEAEQILGQSFKDLGVNRADVVIATKVRGRMGPGPNAVGLTRGHIVTAVKESLARLTTRTTSTFTRFTASVVDAARQTLRALDDLVGSGMVRYIGCSNVMAWQIMKALILSASRNWAPGSRRSRRTIPSPHGTSSAKSSP